VQGPYNGQDQHPPPPNWTHAKLGEPAWCVPQAPSDHPIYRGRWPHGPTPPIHVLGFQAADIDRVPPPQTPDSTADRQPHPLAADTERSRTSIITDPSTWVTGSVCCALQILRRADLSVTFIPRYTEHRPSIARPHTPP
jgi:hypothetical protein